MVSKSGMALLLTALVLRNSQIHVGSSYSHDIITYVEIFVNKSFNFCTILGVPDIDLIIAISDFGDILMTHG